jgi:putative Mg2+ transporter-C (MgtC) family protein
MDSSIPIKLVVAVLLGGIIGIEREFRDKPAGLRTNILICVGSTLFMSISTAYGDTRIAAQIITGIGFLGAGSVLHSHGFVLGLTTAATIWVVAGVGMALGSGMYGVAVFATAMSLAVLYFLSFVEDKIQGRKSYSYTLVVTDLQQALASIHKSSRGSPPFRKLRKSKQTAANAISPARPHPGITAGEKVTVHDSIRQDARSRKRLPAGRKH